MDIMHFLGQRGICENLWDYKFSRTRNFWG